jgi:hypothetical protein
MKPLVWWMRLVGILYILNAVMMAVVRAPIRTAGPVGLLESAAAGDGTARFVVDTWVGFGLEVAAVGIALLAFSRTPQTASALVWCVIGIEFARGLIYDAYMIAQGYPSAVYLPWIVTHTLVIVSGVVALRWARRSAPVDTLAYA